MKAIRYHATGPADVLRVEEIPTPTAGPGQVLVKVAAVGVNFADVGRRAGTFPQAPGDTLPMIPGGEASGVIAALGEGVTGLSVGDRVIARATRSYAEYVVAPVAGIYPLPAGVSFEEGATIPVNFTTAWSCVTGRARVQPGETVLVQAAASGVAIIAVQLAKLAGARVLGTASSDDKLAWAKTLGLDEGINYTTHDFVAEAKRLTDGQGVDVVIDGVGGDVFLNGLKALKRGGRIVVYGVAGGQRTATVTLPELWFQSLTVMGASASTCPRSALEEMLDLVAQGKLKAPVDRAWPFAEVAAAHRHLEDRQVRGKVVLTVP